MYKTMIVSVIITTHNRFEQCKRAIKSVMNQTFKPLEIIVIEDNSNSGIQNWIKENNLEIKYIKNDINIRLAGSRNKAIKEAKGSWIAFLDDDDEWLPSRLEEQVKAYENIESSLKENIACVQCGNETFNIAGKSVGSYLPQNCGNLKKSIIKIGAKTPSSCFLFRKSALEQVNGFSEELISGVDHDIWMKLAVGGYDNLCVKKLLVKIYQEPIVTMMTNTDKRIKGIKQYVEKWTPTYIEWFGELKGKKYAKEYFSNVISGLVAQKIMTRDFGEAKKAFNGIVEFNNSLLSSLKYIKPIVIVILREKLPLSLKKLIKKFV